MSGFVQAHDTHRSKYVSSLNRQPSRYADVKRDELSSASRSKALPSIHHPVPGQSQIGMGGLHVTGQLFPPFHQEDGADTASLGPQHKPLRDRPENPLKGGARPAISAPLLDGESPQPLQRIPTISLEDAARNERKRREAPEQPLRRALVSSFSPEQMSQRSRGSSARKSVMRPPGANAERTLEPILEPDSTAATSGVLLSPAVEDVRRRSPRQPAHSISSGSSERRMPPPKSPSTTSGPATSARDEPAPDTWELLAIPNGDAEEGPDSSRSTRQSWNPAAKGFATLLQTSEKDRFGRHRRSSSISRGSQNTQQLFTDPGVPPPIPVKCLDPKGPGTGRPSREEPPPPYRDAARPDISPSDGSRAQSPTRRELEPATAPSNIPPKTDKFSLFPFGYSNKDGGNSAANPGIGHLRGNYPSTDRSVFLIRKLEYSKQTHRKTTVKIPAQPLPEPSDTEASVRASVLARPRPIPRTPEAALLLYSHGTGPRPNHHRKTVSVESARSKKSVLHSTVPGSPSNLPPLPPVPPDGDQSRTQQPNATKSTAFPESLGMIYPESVSSGGASSKSTRPRSMSLPDIYEMSRKSASSTSLEKDDKGNGAERSTTSSIKTHSIFSVDEKPGPPGTLHSRPKSSTRNARSKSRERHPQSHQDVGTRHNQVSTDSPDISVNKPNPIIATDELSHKDVPPSSLQSKQSASQQTKDSTAAGHTRPGPWKSRLGQECSTFSTRRGALGSRRGPPPTPLLLNTPSHATMVRLEPSPLESPSHALEMIEEQLRQLETESQTSNVDERQRMTLIADLEKEMGLQEDHWYNMRHTILRDSLSTVNMSPQRPRDSIGQRASVVSRRLRELPELSPSIEDLGLKGGRYGFPLDTRADAESRRSSAPRLSKAGSRASHLTVSRPTTIYAGSPTPPDTDESEMRQAIPLLYGGMLSPTHTAPPSLWRYTIPSPTFIKHEPCLWSPSGEASLVVPEPMVPPVPRKSPNAKSLAKLDIVSSRLWQPLKEPRRVPPGSLWTSPREPTEALDQISARKSEKATISLGISEKPKPCLWSPSRKPPSRKPEQIVLPALRSAPKARPLRNMTIASSRLWQPPEEPRQIAPWGLWTPPAPAPVTAPKARRDRLAQKPMRRKKRITTLPDILESPSPLSGGCDTLGIFQFPWGEKSGTGTVPMPTIPLGAMPGTMAAGGAKLNLGLTFGPQLQIASANQSAFDGHEAEETYEDLAEYGSDVQDDDFDDSTLWEIASVLKKTDVLSPTDDVSDEDGMEADSVCSDTPEATSSLPREW